VLEKEFAILVAETVEPLKASFEILEKEYFGFIKTNADNVSRL